MSEAEQPTSPTPGLSAGGDVADKFNTAKEKKAAGDEAFKNNDIVTGAHTCLQLAISMCVLNDTLASSIPALSRSEHLVYISVRGRRSLRHHPQYRHSSI